MGKRLSWVKSFISRELYAPFFVKTDSEYLSNLEEKYKKFNKLLTEVSADEESIAIARKYTNKICEAIYDYYKGRVSTCHQKIDNLVKNCSDNILAKSELSNSMAFPGNKNYEIQLFRARASSEMKKYPSYEMLHLPFSMRAKTGNYRFSIPGVTSLYLANSSYGCWIEVGQPTEHDFNVSPVVLDGTQNIFNLAVMFRDHMRLNDYEIDRVHCWIKLLALMIATSYKIEESNRTFRSEYIISQSIMLACKKQGYDGVAYYSKRVDDEMFARVAINLALFADYQKNKKYGSICEHIKVDESMNYQMFKQIIQNQEIGFDYRLRVDSDYFTKNIGSYHRQYSYIDTDFYRFDKFLFSTWKDKEFINWGNAIPKE